MEDFCVDKFTTLYEVLLIVFFITVSVLFIASQICVLLVFPTRCVMFYVYRILIVIYAMGAIYLIYCKMPGIGEIKKYIPSKEY